MGPSCLRWARLALVVGEDLTQWQCLRVKSQSAAKMTSSSIVRQIAAPIAKALKPSRNEAANFARVVVLTPQIKRIGVKVSAPSVAALKP